MSGDSGGGKFLLGIGARGRRHHRGVVVMVVVMVVRMMRLLSRELRMMASEVHRCRWRHMRGRVGGKTAISAACA